MKGFIIDLDGTIYQGNQLIDGAKAFIDGLQSRNIPYLFATNNSLYTPKVIAEKINKMGIIVEEEKVITSSLATAAYLKQEKPECKVSVIGGAGLYEAIESAGFEITDTSPDVIVQGVDPTFTYDTLQRVFGQIQYGADYVLTNPDTLIPVEDGFLPGAGSIAAAIQTASQVSPLVIGKPSPIIMEFAMERMGLYRKDICVVGDNLLTDMQAGWKAGCHTAWVMTGIAPTQLNKNLLEKQEFKPDVICDNLQELLDRDLSDFLERAL